MYSTAIKTLLVIKILLLSFCVYGTTSAYTSDDIVVIEQFITDYNIHDVYSVPTGKDLIINRIDASSSSTEVEVYNNNTTIIKLDNEYVYTNFIVIKDYLKASQDTSSDRTWTFQGYLVDEGAELSGDTIDLSQSKYTSDDLIQLWIDFLSNDRLWQLYVLYFIWFIAFYMIWLNIKWWFITGVAFYKNHFVNKK